MTESTCPKSQLTRLICDELNPQDTGRIMEHLERCKSCQAELEFKSADQSWWNRVTVGLKGIPTDKQNRVLEPETKTLSIDTMLEFDSNTKRATHSQPVLDMLDPPTHPEMLGQIDEFEIEAKIGQGGMGIVFRGFDRSLNRPVAIKVLAPHLGSNDVARQRFEREAKAAAAVVHPSVVPIYRVSTTNKDRPYIAMALADGLSLQEHVTAHGPFDVKDVVRIGIQIASGLAEAHKQGLIHRDIKPANVLMEKDVSRILITDFGLARAADDVMMTQSGCLAGTPSYMSPEQVVGTELDHRSDLFSLGSLLYFISTGREPFRAESAFAVINKVTRAVPKSPRNINVDIPEVLNRIIERLLEKNPVNRIESAAKLEELLTQVLAHLQEPKQHSFPDVKATTIERRRVARQIGWGMAIVGIFLAGGLAWNGFFHESSASPRREHDNDSHSFNGDREHFGEHDPEGADAKEGSKHKHR